MSDPDHSLPGTSWNRNRTARILYMCIQPFSARYMDYTIITAGHLEHDREDTRSDPRLTIYQRTSDGTRECSLAVEVPHRSHSLRGISGTGTSPTSSALKLLRSELTKEWLTFSAVFPATCIFDTSDALKHANPDLDISSAVAVIGLKGTSSTKSLYTVLEKINRSISLRTTVDLGHSNHPNPSQTRIYALGGNVLPKL